MADDSTTMPTAEELAQADAIRARQVAATRAMAQKLVSFTGSFDDLLAAAIDFRDTVGASSPWWAPTNSLITGMSSMKSRAVG